MYSSEDIRKKRDAFWQAKQHAEATPASLVAASEDKTVLFNIAGMQPIVPYLSGKPHPDGTRLYNIQRCIRTNDIDEVGDNTHCTFFEMMGNRSLGDYFKKESLTRTIEFLTKELDIPLSRLGGTIFGGFDDKKAPIPFDQEAKDILIGLGIPEDKIQSVPMYAGQKCDNFWGPAGPIGPCGPCCEIYYDKGDEYGIDDRDYVGNDARYVEIRNNVFMSMYKDKDGSLSPLEQKNIDTGMGFERLMTFLQHVPSVYETDLFAPLLQTVQTLTGVQYPLFTNTPQLDTQQQNVVRSFRIVVEHARSVTFLLADGVIPSNEGRGYVLRRLMRRMRYHLTKLYTDTNFDKKNIQHIVQTLFGAVIAKYSVSYDHLLPNQKNIFHMSSKEIIQFESTLQKGSSILDGLLQSMKTGTTLDGKTAFTLYDTYGFPFDLTRDISLARGFAVDEEGFEKALEHAKKQSKAASATMFHKDIDRASYLTGIAPTTFVGYTSDSFENMKILKDFVVDDVRVLVFDTTPFYAESGGQVADQGYVFDDEGNKLFVSHVKKYDGVYLHFVESE